MSAKIIQFPTRIKRPLIAGTTIYVEEITTLIQIVDKSFLIAYRGRILLITPGESAKEVTMSGIRNPYQPY